MNRELAERARYAACYCEENVHQLLSQLAPQDLRSVYAVFVSNQAKQAPLFRQRAGHGDDGAVIWDYHVLAVEAPRGDRPGAPWTAWDVDSTLGLGCPLDEYVREALRPGDARLAARPTFRRSFRVVHGPQFLQHFASDRSHMLLAGAAGGAAAAGAEPEGRVGRRMAQYSAPPPAAPCLVAPATGATHTLPRYWDMLSDLCQGAQVQAMRSLADLPQQAFGCVLGEQDFCRLAACTPSPGQGGQTTRV